MAIVVQLVKEFAPWVYGTCALLALICLGAAFRARRERRWAMFGLEREQALNKTLRVWSWAGLLLVLMGSVYFVSTVVSEAVGPLIEIEQASSPTPGYVVQGSVTPTLPAPETTPTTPTQAPATPTPRPMPTQTPGPTRAEPTPAPAVQAPGCPDARAVISAPGYNASVSGMVPIVGTAAHEQFQYYKLEFGGGSNPTVWSYFAGGEQAVRGGRLGVLNADALAPGTYSIRIVVVDQSGNFPPPCVTVVVIG